jgi:[ribosomal protein S5]-alanine N-acetyltransferase
MPPVIRLVPIPAAHLSAMARGEVPAELLPNVLADGLPPPHVAQRVLGHLAAGKSTVWVSMYYVLDADGCCVAGCGFKDIPRERQVEVGYGVATARRGRGYASAALLELLRIAAASGEVDVVNANIAPENAASMKVARRAGFVPGETVFEDTERLVVWRRTLDR